MKIVATKNTLNFLLISGIISFFVVGVLDMGIQMQTRTDGTMTPCLFNGKAEVCTMTFAQHLTQWQSMFTATASQKALASVFLILLAVAFVAVAIFKRNLFSLFSYHTTRWKLYIRHNPHLSLFNPLQEAFSQGILNPKSY